MACRVSLRKLSLRFFGSCFAIGPWLRGCPWLASITVQTDREVTVEVVGHLARLSSLKELVVHQASAVEFRSPLLGLTSLKVADCSIGTLPPGLSTLTRLVKLEVYGARLGGADLSALSRLRALALLCLSRCGLRAFPTELRALPNLQRLLLQGTAGSVEQLDAISALGKLRDLSLADCGLRSLPASLCALTQLTALFLNGNRLSALPGGPWLRGIELLSLDLASLCRLKEGLGGASQLATLFLTRTGEAEEQHCQGVEDALLSLPALWRLYYVRSAERTGQPFRESFSLMKCLTRLADALCVELCEKDETHFSSRL